jgi:hypothetical protein
MMINGWATVGHFLLTRAHWRDLRTWHCASLSLLSTFEALIKLGYKVDHQFKTKENNYGRFPENLLVVLVRDCGEFTESIFKLLVSAGLSPQCCEDDLMACAIRRADPIILDVVMPYFLDASLSVARLIRWLNICIEEDFLDTMALLLARAGALLAKDNENGVLIMTKAMRSRKEQALGVCSAFYLKTWSSPESLNGLLLTAVLEGFPETVTLLLSNGANPFIQDENGRDLLTLAILSHQKAVLSSVASPYLESSPPPENLNFWLQIAACQAFPEALMFLLANGADPLSKNQDSLIPLALYLDALVWDWDGSFRHGKHECFAALTALTQTSLDRGLNLRSLIENDDQDFCFSKLVIWGGLEIIKVWIENGADPGHKDEEGVTFLDLAREYHRVYSRENSSEIIRYLESRRVTS